MNLYACPWCSKTFPLPPDPRLAALVEAASYGLSAFRKCVGLVAMIDGEGIIAVRAGRAALKRMDAALAALEEESRDK